MSAVILLQEIMLAKRLDPAAFQDEEDDLPVENSKDRTAVLAIAYHNMGVEQEFLRSFPAAILSYKKAVNFAEKNLGPDDGITQNLRNVFENAKIEVSTMIPIKLILKFYYSSIQAHTSVARKVLRVRAKDSRVSKMLDSTIKCLHQEMTWNKLTSRTKLT